jgi:hypothetical protein
MKLKLGSYIRLHEYIASSEPLTVHCTVGYLAYIGDCLIGNVYVHRTLLDRSISVVRRRSFLAIYRMRSYILAIASSACKC